MAPRAHLVVLLLALLSTLSSVAQAFKGVCVCVAKRRQTDWLTRQAAVLGNRLPKRANTKRGRFHLSQLYIPRKECYIHTSPNRCWLSLF